MKNIFLINILEIVKNFGPWAVALVGFLSFIITLLYNIDKDERSKRKLAKLQEELESFRKEAEKTNEISRQKLSVLDSEVTELKRHTEQFKKSNTFLEKASDATFLPEVIISRNSIFLYSNEIDFLPFKFSLRRLIDRENSSLNSSINVEVINIGFAPAKNVEWKWKFNITNAISILQKGLGGNLFSIEYLNGKVLRIQKKMTGDTFITMADQQSKMSSLDFLLPSSVNIKSFPIKIPDSYLHLFSIWLGINLLYPKKEEQQSLIAKILEKDLFPPLTLGLNYRDLQGKSFTKNYNLMFNINWLNISKNKSAAELSPNGEINIEVKQVH